jgi:crotonobetainyl-CoA:carnitine CoA-transferase CaiB-like acyl-CoA transferase
MPLPLDGNVVADLTHALAGPFCTQQLHLLGADVIKIEPERGDDFRERRAAFAALNAGKRSVVLDLKSDGGQEALRRLVEQVDVLVENYRPGVTRQLGIDYASLRPLNSGLVYCSISGYGQDGPLHTYPAIEWAVQAMSGMAAGYIADEVDGAYLGLGVLDPFSGYVAFSAILAALLQRHTTGEGQHIDTAMLDAAMLLMAPRVASESLGESSRSGMGRRPTMVRFRAQDRRLFVAALHRPWFEKLAQIIGAPALLTDPRFTSQRSQTEHADALIAEIEARLATRPAAEWETLFVAAGLPASVVRSLDEILAHAHLRQRGTLVQVNESATGDSASVVGAGFRFGHDQPTFRGPVPALGQHTAEVLAELGLSPDGMAPAGR